MTDLVELSIDARFEQAHGLHQQGHLDNAIAAYRAILADAPDEPEILRNLAQALNQAERYEEGLATANLTIALLPTMPGAWFHKASALHALCRYRESVQAYNRCLELAPDMPAAMWNRGHVRLTLGDWGGWCDLRAGFVSGQRKPRSVRPEWELGETTGTLLVWAEQGQGDTLQMVGLLPWLRSLFHGRIVLEVQRSLVGLLTGFPYADEVVAQNPEGATPPGVDWQLSLMELPAHLPYPIDMLGSSAPYLTVAQADRAKWAGRITGDVRIGWCTHGSPGHAADAKRSIPYEVFAPILAADEPDWYYLHPSSPLGLNDWRDTAAVVEQLDLVITVDTAVAHLAGAMGKPVWILLAAPPDYRWGLESEDTPWYPTARLFRQSASERGQWGPVVERVAAEVRRFVAEKQAQKQAQKQAAGQGGTDA